MAPARLSFNFQFSQKRRGLSQIMGSLLLLAIVVPIGTTILFSGTSEINAFNNELTNSAVYKNDGIQEDLIFEHIRFEPTTGEVMITVRNTGSVETTIDRISLINMTNQKLLFKIDGLSSFSPTVIPIKNNAEITIEASPEGGTWNSATSPQKEYKISIITSRGNFFDTVARPFNT